MDEDKQANIIDQFEQTSQNWTGESWTREKAVEQYMQYGAAKQSQVLDWLDEAVRTCDTSNLRKYTELTSLRRDCRNIRRALREAGR
jgi:hypothetical protein